MVGERLKEERERLQMTQPAFAAAAGAAKRTLIEWEKGSTSPNAVQLSALGEIGVDVLYVVTGKTQRQLAAEQAASVAASGVEALRELQYLQQGELRVAEPPAFPLIHEKEVALLASYRACTEEERNALIHMAQVLANRNK